MTSPAAAQTHTAPKQFPPAREPWFALFLRRELAPYPGRVSLVARMVVSAALTVLIANAFRLPGQAIGVFFTFLIPRDSLRSTFRQSFFAVLSFVAGALYIMLGVATLIESPVAHLLFVVGTAYLLFFLVATASNYGTAAGFLFMVASALPLWDLPGNQNAKVASTLYILLSIVIGMACTAAVEAVYRSFPTQDLVVAGVADRLDTVSRALAGFAETGLPDPSTRARVLQYALIGSSTLRQQLIRSGQRAAVRAYATAIVSMTNRLVELCAAAVRQGRARPSTSDRERLASLAQSVHRQAAAVRALKNVQLMGATALPSFEESLGEASQIFTLAEMERSARLLSTIPNALLDAQGGLADRNAVRRKLPPPPQGKLWGLLVPDAYKRVNFVFALRGCLAASLCYLIYNSIAWPGISTSFVTCMITALGSVGASRQKQVLRISGAIIGGLLIALPAQAFLLPHMDSISAFLLFFILVSAFAAWIATASQRLGYCGIQVALAFDLINANEPFRQISLAVGRDRVIGILLGLVAMWVVFDQIAPVRASDRMKTLLRGTLDKLGDLAGAVAELRGAQGAEAALRCEMLRDTINNDLSTMNGEADAVQFEYGPDRARQLRERERMLAMQPPMRSLFLLALTVWEAEALPHSENESSAPEAFLRAVAGTFHALATAVSRPAKGKRIETIPELETTIAAVQRALGSMREEPETIRLLCRTMLFSLRALERSAAGRPQF